MKKREIIEWHRKQANWHNAVANTLEEEEAPEVLNGCVTIEGIREYLRTGKQKRVPQIALHFGVSEDEVRALVVRSDSGVSMANTRGWLSLCDMTLPASPVTDNHQEDALYD